MVWYLYIEKKIGVYEAYVQSLFLCKIKTLCDVSWVKTLKKQNRNNHELG